MGIFILAIFRVIQQDAFKDSFAYLDLASVSKIVAQSLNDFGPRKVDKNVLQKHIAKLALNAPDEIDRKYAKLIETNYSIVPVKLTARRKSKEIEVKIFDNKTDSWARINSNGTIEIRRLKGKPLNYSSNIYDK